MCDFCCLVDFEFCSRDIGICEPVTDRHIDIIAHCGYVFVGVLMGFPIIIGILECFIAARCCSSWFPTTGGITCYEIIMRSLYILVFITFTQNFRKPEPIIEDLEDPVEGKGICFKTFYYSCFCFLCPGLWRKKKVPVEEVIEEGEEEEYGEEEEGEDADVPEQEQPKAPE